MDYEQPGAYWVMEDLYICRKCKERTATVCGKPCTACVLDIEVWDVMEILKALPLGQCVVWDELHWKAETLLMRRAEVES